MSRERGPTGSSAQETEFLIGFGSLLSKKGITREGSVPKVRDAWAVRLLGRRGFSNAIRGGRKMVMDAYLDGHEVIAVRHLPAFLDISVVGAQPDVPVTGPSFEALGLVVDRKDWLWFDKREEFPPAMGRLLLDESGSTGRPIGDLLGEILERAGPDGYVRALHERYRAEGIEVDEAALTTGYLPWPVRLPDHDGLVHRWGVLCVLPEKRLPPLDIRSAAGRPGVDAEEMRHYYLDAVLGAAHGLDVSDLKDPDYEEQQGLDALVGRYLEQETLPLDSLLGEGLLAFHGVEAPRRTHHTMRPLTDLVPYDETLRRLLQGVTPLDGSEEVGLEDAVGRVLVDPVVAAVDVPAFDRSAMDGYAMRAEDTYGAGPLSPRRLRLIGRHHAGVQEGVKVEIGTCLQVATGSPLPPGADTVVMVERTREAERDVIEVLVPHTAGKNVALRGSDVQAGSEVLPSGSRLLETHVATLAAVGVDQVRVRRRPRVAVVPSGEEIVPVGRPLGPGQVHDSNGPGITALVTRLGAEAQPVPIVGDTDAALRDAVRSALAEADLVVFTGGTSAGERDLLGDVLAELGEVVFHGIRIRPGKPVLCARIDGKTVLGLPGYPASCLLTAHLFLGPLIERLSGVRPTPRAVFSAPLGHAVSSKQGFTQFVPVALDVNGSVRSVFDESGATTSLSRSFGYFVVPEDVTRLEKGHRVDVLPW
ncbi:MAG: molybdopterin molybdotransferase MoeA [Euryarchaeota archaeon]|nr:molybdopterin molybdotransferase MoeA [Euryarchaeota archaeon]